MASIRQHPRSPYWYLRRRDDDSGEWKEQATGLRWDDAAQTRKAWKLAEKASAAETAEGTRTGQAFISWVPTWLVSHYRHKSPATLRRMTHAWNSVRQWLRERGIIYARQIRYTHAADFIAWRTGCTVHGKKTGYNTALLEIKFLSQLVNEAIRMEFAESNPLLRLGIARAPQKIKPELSDAEIATLRAAIKSHIVRHGKKMPDGDEWMRVAFEIALYTGCRFSECSIPVDCIDLDAGTLRIRDAKRAESDPRKWFTVPIHRGLRKTLARIVASVVKFRLGFQF